jgi:uncharacterized protein
MIFIDTGPFIAKYLKRDQYHATARKIWNSIKEKSLFVSNFVLDELLTYTGRITGNRFISEKIRLIYTSQTFQILRPTPEDELSALDFFEKYSDQLISYTDCISFALMKKNGIQQVFSFDHHFSIAGFEIIE